jgi:hypothetical protein
MNDQTNKGQKDHNLQLKFSLPVYEPCLLGKRNVHRCMHKSPVLSKKNQVKPSKTTSLTSHLTPVCPHIHTGRDFVWCRMKWRTAGFLRMWGNLWLAKTLLSPQEALCSTQVSVSAYHLGRDSSVGIATRYGLHGPGIESRWRRDFPQPSRLPVVPTQPPI